MAERGVVEEEFNEEKAKSDEDLETIDSESIIAALNIALILSSLSSPDPDEQRLNLVEIERENGNRGKNSGSRSNFPARSQQLGGFSRALERQQSSKVQAKIRDCRYASFLNPYLHLYKTL